VELTGKQRRYLRSIGQRLKPVVMIGRAGLSGSVMKEIEHALKDHELIKVRLGRECDIERKEAAKRISEQSHSALAQVVGSTMLLYRPRKEDPAIELPQAGGPSGEEA
jgi:RNA-binding protein